MRQSALLLLLIIMSFFSIVQKADTTKLTMIQMINKGIELYNAQSFAELKEQKLQDLSQFFQVEFIDLP